MTDDPGDELFDVAAVEGGAWAPGPYGAGDRLGTYNEVGPQQTAAALALLDPGRPVRTFSLGETVFNGYPAFGTRRYEQHLVLSGYEPAPSFAGEVAGVRPGGANRLSYHEERVHTTYNLGTKINGLHHCGVGAMFYGGVQGPDVARTWGTTELDTPSWGPPLCTRGLMLDLVALKVDRAESDSLIDVEGAPVLAGDYRVTVEDLTAAAQRQDLPTLEPGDAVLLRTGWNRLIRVDPRRYLAGNPGPYLRECRWLARSRPALVGSDTWAFEVVAPAVRGRNISPCHQELFMRFGIRIAEGVRLDELAAAGVDRFVFCHSPLRAEGAIASSSPPMALANVS
ncbi:MAG TPA: cyclase family protein [Acidimicrobiales bacterium]|nr:cyclase family protein [Acidimicrobiales bacterium]